MTKWHDNNAGKLLAQTYNFLNKLRNEENALFYDFTLFIWTLIKYDDLIYIFMYMLFDLLFALF